ncbi:MAG TPA: hypothetical protein VN081_02835, partial [Dongiaceae bacterium]|nr:hypothetical protein [Dongiaceae bacterium]
MSFRFINPNTQFLDANGQPLAVGSLTFYEPSSTTLKTTYSDEALTIANTNPLPLDASGRPSSEIFISGQYRVILKDSGGVTIWDRDHVDEAVTAASIQNGAANYAGLASGSANAIVLTLTPAISSLADGLIVGFRVFASNTGPVTINVNSTGAVSASKGDGSPLAADDLRQNELVTFRYNQNQTRFDLYSPANAFVQKHGADTKTGNLTIDTGNLTINAGQLKTAARVSVASAVTVDLSAVLSNTVNITGSVLITAITLQDGGQISGIFQDATTLTTSASLVVVGHASGETLNIYAGDTFTAFADSVATRLFIQTPHVLASGNISTTGDTTVTIPAGTFKKLKLTAMGIVSASNYQGFLTLNADSGANYRWQQFYSNSGSSSGATGTAGQAGILIAADST